MYVFYIKERKINFDFCAGILAALHKQICS
uniref:Uncharacterized protein n=1 Tax=Anguilla anguilla TaxID=7936 RepID=A0A0E9PZ71_ANGAN